MPAKYLGFGIIIDDMVFYDGRTYMGTLGGGGPQTAWGMALAAGDPGDAGVLSGIGDDLPRPDFLAPLQRAGIDLSGVFLTDFPTPRAWELVEEDERRRHIWRTDPTPYFETQIGLHWESVQRFYPGVQVAHWGIHPASPNLSLYAPLQAHGALTSIEVFLGTKTPMPDDPLRDILSQCDIFSPNWGEAVSIFGTEDRTAMVARSRALGGRVLSLRLGAAGAEVWDVQQGFGARVPAAPMAALVDVVGAGNAFCGAFAVRYHESGDLLEAAVSASVAASYMLEQVGMPLHPPSADDLAARDAAVRAGAVRLAE